MKYDIIFNKDGNGRIKKTRFPDGESLITVLNTVKGKTVLYVTEEKMREHKQGVGFLDWVMTISACVQNGAKRVDVVVDFHKNSDYYIELAKKFVCAVGANVYEDKSQSSTLEDIS